MTEKTSKNSPLLKNIVFAFLIGGAICAIGEGFANLYGYLGLDRGAVKTAVPITMIFIGSLLTGLKVYHRIAKYGGGGTLVPITGFANAIVAPAMEYKSEGYVMGVGAKMFTIAGPVLVYGIVSSIIYGIILILLGKV